MAPGGWCTLSIAPGVLLPSSPAKVTAAGRQNWASSTKGDLIYHQASTECARAGRGLTSCSASPSPPSSFNQCRESGSLANVLCCGHHHGASPSSSETLVGVMDERKSRLGRGPTRQQRKQLGRDAAVRRLLQSPSRSSEWLGNFCKATWKETSGDVVSISPTRESSRRTLDCSLSSQSRYNSYQSEKLKFWIITVSTSDELLAAATLRAQLFYSYPKFSPNGSGGLEGMKARLKHDFDVQDLLKSRVKSEFERDTKMQDLNMNVKCLLAVCEEPNHDELLMSSNEKINSLTSPPTVDSPAFSRRPLVAIGTLDIQDGTGSIPTADVNSVTFQLYNVANGQEKKFSTRRQVSEKGPGHRLLSLSSNKKLHVNHGYIFNLCVSHTARRHGVATALMKEAVHVAQRILIRTLYVHVEANNGLALALYQKLGYIVEEEEPMDVEHRFQRPRRILLSYRSP